MRSVIVVGGGISGLAAAWQLRGRADVTVLEGRARVGGKLRTGTIAGITVDEGAESLMALRPEAVELAAAVGLGNALRDPERSPTTIWTDGALRPLPAGHVMGIPTDPAALTGTGLLSAEGVRRAVAEETLAAVPLTEDCTVSAYLGARLGQEAVDRLVEPLLGGVYAGRADRLSLRAAMPRIAALAEQGAPLLPALRRIRAAGAPHPAAVAVQGVAGGTGRFPQAVARACGARILTGTTARSLHRLPGGGWRVQAMTSDGPLTMDADGVILALPAFAAAELLRPHSPLAEEELAAIPHASTAVVTMAFSRARSHFLPQGNGFLVPPVDGHTLKAASFLSNKWAWLHDSAPSVFVLRASIGRIGEEELLDRPDRHLVRTAIAELHHAVGPMGEPLAARVTRWDRGLPQYGVGHRERVTRIREAVGKLPGLAVCGAAYEGVGVAACVATGRNAAKEILADD
ncbi:protoporphyrinogen oxidase [Streptomyces sp. Isolate_45]|uniref:protoporphyrinogen oxidase n=1 Tax=Streptomyces sp. Isolate_45 TaxID=2950111 RepID=UPI002481B63C|nr:protoporphyrinogen oxidase [Streptomyces sp. Isolate_45]MDA5285156.1 protoporphyrinogen oxidase [Streptomyces sp. Isolate_45]